MTLMTKLSKEDVIKTADEKNLIPVKLRSKDEAVAFQKKDRQNPRSEQCSWDDFFAVLAKKNLAVYGMKGYMKIMKADA